MLSLPRGPARCRGSPRTGLRFGFKSTQEAAPRLQGKHTLNARKNLRKGLGTGAWGRRGTGTVGGGKGWGEGRKPAGCPPSVLPPGGRQEHSTGPRSRANPRARPTW